MKNSSRFRFFALLWIGFSALACSQPIMAQFDEAPRNFWVIDFSVGGNLVSSPNVVTNKDKSSYYDVRDFTGDSGPQLGLTFGLNRRLFGNFYAGIHLGYKYYHTPGNISIYHRGLVSNDFKYDKTIEMSVDNHLLALPIEIGYNHTYSHKYGLNVYLSIIPGYCVKGSANSSDKNYMGQNVSGKHVYESWGDYMDVNPGFCVDTALGLRYFIQHFYIGASFHYGINNAQKQLSEMGLLGSIGYRF